MTDIETLAAIEAIKQLRARYVRCIDTKDWAEFEAVFCPDATADYGDAGVDPVSGRSLQDAFSEGGEPETTMRYAGSAVIAKGVREAVGTRVTVHHVFSPEIEVLSPSAARGIWALEDLVKWPAGAEGAFRGFHGYGHYRETYGKVLGQWRIKSLRVTRLLIEFF